MKVPTTLPEIPEMIASKRDEIAALCCEYGVAKLEVFGSVMTDEFDPETSEVDFLVEYRADTDLGPWLTNHANLVSALAAILDRRVSMRMTGAPGYRNRFLMQLIETTRVVIFREA